MTTNHEAVLARMAKALNERNYADFEAMLTEDYVEEYPQSGEVIRGVKNARAMLEHYPGGLPEAGVDMSAARIAVTEARWVRTPTFTVVRVEGTGSVGTAAYKVRYPDGSVWWAIQMYELRGDRFARSTMFFAPLFAAPEWRKPYVERADVTER